MRKTLFGIVLLLLVAATPALADITCARGQVCTVQLTQTNVTQLAGVVVTVTIDNRTNRNHTILSFALTNNPVSATNHPLGIDMIGWNGGASAAAISSSANWGGASPALASHQLDGFGSFAIYGASPAGTGGTSTSNKLTFTLAGLVTSFPLNAGGNAFALHLRFTNSCSGCIGGPHGSTDPTSDSNCGRTPSVPEPGSMALFGTGLMGLAGLLKRRLRG